MRGVGDEGQRAGQHTDDDLEHEEQDANPKRDDEPGQMTPRRARHAVAVAVSHAALLLSRLSPRRSAPGSWFLVPAGNV
ncbi:hypothetical protein GCM10023214_13750 [Amycolatopsis dongchuanensis]|uniref:Uncharacterized protein n=1 Tax=Amycolatopsis dongchuanensis TaxID=1070866 RepID=A0ABP9QAI4_9PSEU